MRLFVDLDTNQVTQDVGSRTLLKQINFKRSNSRQRIEVVFWREIQAISLPDNTAGKFALKVNKDYDDDFVIAALSWEKEQLRALPVYVFYPTLSSPKLDELLLVDGNPGNDKESVTLMGEIKWYPDGGEQATNTFLAVVANNVIRDDEGVPQDPNPQYPAAGDVIAKGTTGDNFRFTADGQLQLKNTTTEKWHTLTVSGNDGEAMLAVSADGEN